MSKIVSLIRRAPKRTSALVAMIAAAVILPAALFAWGPARATYTTAHPADHVVFNSITDNPVQGDERNFMQVREANASNSTYADSISLAAGHQYVVYVYYHNNAASNLNASGKGIAKDAYVKAQLPAVVPKGSTGTKAVGYVGASNANPKEVWDDIAFKNSSAGDMALRYVPGSATIHNFGKSNGQTMADSIVTSGAKLGYDKLDGTVPGCNQYAGYVTFRVEADQPNFTMKKQVRISGTTEWKDSVTANPGQSVDYLLSYDNTGTTWQNNVVMSDTLPKGVSYVAGSTKLYNSTNPNGLKVSDNVTKGGINIGNYKNGSNAYVMITGKVASKDALTCGKNTLTNKATAETSNGNKSDTAIVTVNKDCTPPPCSYVCKSLTVTKVDRTHFMFASTHESQNATYKSTTYVVRDASGKEVYRGPSTSFTTETAGNYTVQAYVTFSVNGSDKTVTSDSCKKPFVVEEKPVVPVYTCKALTVTTIDRTHFTFATSYTATNATYKSTQYVVTDANGKVVYQGASASFSTETVGNYTVQAFVTFTVNGASKTVTSDSCKKPFTVEQKPVTPVYTCDLLTADKIDRTSFKFTTTATAEGGAQITGYSYDFGDGTTTPGGATINHSYTKDGAYHVKVTVSFLVNGKAVTADGAHCTTSVTVTPVPPKQVEVCNPETGKIITVNEDQASNYKPVGDEACQPVQVCNQETGKIMTVNKDQASNYKPVDDVACQPTTPTTPTTPSTPSELPHTGMSGTLVAVLGAGSLIGAIGYYVASRRALS